MLAGCDTLSGWFGPKDEPELDEAADKIYNEGLYLLNAKKDIKAAAKIGEKYWCPKKRPNKAPEPTPMSVTSPANVRRIQ